MRSTRPARPRRPSSRPADPREATAHHEAGHCAVALYYSFDVVEVSVVPDPARGRLGHCRLATYEGLLPHQRLVYLLAGIAAEWHWRHRGSPPPLGEAYAFRRWSSSDCRQARLGALLASEPGATADLLAYAQRQAALVVSVPAVWSAIRLLARALLRDGTLDGDRARRIYTAAIEAARKG